MALLLTEQDVCGLLTMKDAIEALEHAFADLDREIASNIPRRRTRTDKVMLHLMGAAGSSIARIGLKSYTTGAQGARFHVLLYDGDSGELLAFIQADWLGRIRTGAASGLATRLMAREDAATLGVIGAGKQAETQIQAICEVRDIREVRVWSRTKAKRDAFVDKMQLIVDPTVVGSDNGEGAVRGADIVVTATTSRSPVLAADWVEPGTHINAVGSNALSRSELDLQTVRKCDLLVVDSKAQCPLEAGNLTDAVDSGELGWDSLTELSELVAGKLPGRESREQITIFQSLGLAVEDVYVADKILALARSSGVGQQFQF